MIYLFALLTLFPLLFYKYLNFILQTGASVLQWVGIDMAPAAFTWLVPLGLSFYTFQALGYLWDVYRKEITAEKNLKTYMLFVSFFPQILCGPISKASNLLPQLRTPRPFNYTQGIQGLRYILWGMFIKLVLADRVGIYTNTIYNNFMSYSGTSSLLAAIFYSLQIYGDFAGYSYIAIGCARLLGIDLIINFRRPYFAQSVSEFWKRWNISLTKWLTSYIYIPLGGSRRGKVRTYLNILVTFLVSGIWHGANWTFIFWGILHGIAQIIEKACGIVKIKSKGFLSFFRILTTFCFVTLAWVYFRMPDIGDANNLIYHIFDGGVPYFDSKTISYSLIAIALVFSAEYLIEFRRDMYAKIMNNYTIIRWSVYIVLTMFILLFGVLDSSQFIYIKF